MCSCSRCMSRRISPTWWPTEATESFRAFTLSFRLSPWSGFISWWKAARVLLACHAAIVPGIDAMAVINAAMPARSCHQARLVAAVGR